MTGIKQKVFADYDEAETWASIQETMRINFVLSKDRPIEISIEPWKGKRSTEQNAKMWAMIRHINSDQGWGISDTNAKNILTAECFGSRVVNGHEVYASTSSMDVGQLSTFIDWLERYGAENGIAFL